MSRSRAGAGKRVRWIGLVVVSLLLVGLKASGQETTDVVIVLEFPEETQPNLGTGGGSNSTVTSSQRTSTYVLKELLLPGMEIATRVEKEAMEETRERGREIGFGERPRTFGAMVRYERVDFDNIPGFDLDGDIYSTNFLATWRVEKFKCGLLVPYEYLDLEDTDAHRMGALGFAQYTMPMTANTRWDLIVNGNYTHTAMDNSDLEDVNTYGGGLGLGMTADLESYVWGGAALYQFNADDSDSKNDEQHLLKFSTDFGVRVGKPAIMTFFAIWTYDATNYDDTTNDVDDSYFELGLDAGWSLSGNWRLHGGYKKVLGLDDFDSDMFFLGTLLRF